MGFVPFTFVDFIDIILVAVIMYWIYRMTKGTNAPYILSGIIAIYLLWVVVRTLNMELLSTILGQLISVGAIALIIVFQPELRRFLQMIGMRQKHFNFITRIFSTGDDAVQTNVVPIVTACREMSETKTGALIVIGQQSDLRLIAEGGIYIEDYSDIEQQVAEIAHVDLIEQELLDKPRDTVIIHMYLEPGDSPVETLALIAARMEAAGIPYTSETEGVEQEDWQNGWRKYYETSRVKLILDPGLAFGTGGHETTNLCLEVLDERVRGGERVLDIGTGSGILAIAALKLGAAVAEGVDIDPVAVRTAGENAALNGVADKLTVLVGDLSDKASGKYDIITANIVANAIMALAPAVPGLMADDAVFIASGIIDERIDEVRRAAAAVGFTWVDEQFRSGWYAVLMKR